MFCCIGLDQVDGIKDFLSGIFRLVQFWYDLYFILYDLYFTQQVNAYLYVAA